MPLRLKFKSLIFILLLIQKFIRDNTFFKNFFILAYFFKLFLFTVCLLINHTSFIILENSLNSFGSIENFASLPYNFFEKLKSFQ